MKIDGASHPLSELEVSAYVGVTQKGDLLVSFPRYDLCRKAAEWRENGTGNFKGSEPVL
ncbi:MAG: hypothetical protein J1F01_06040 [Oscillospiraceae bacterium]|nr:hypothetical protein [Oscillospiraceae bacterium]